jgi:hypothetical protein
MKIDEIKNRVNELICMADSVLVSRYADGLHYKVSSEEFYGFKTASLSFIQNIYGNKHPFFIEFEKNVKSNYSTDTENGKGILKSIKQEIEGGWIFTVKGIISAEIFSDFLEMAKYLLDENYKDPAAVMIGSVLEEHLRNLCNKNNIEVDTVKDSKSVPKKADLLNSELSAASVYNKLDHKSVTSWLDLRNKAAHGKYDEYTKEQVNIMFSGVTDFIARTS